MIDVGIKVCYFKYVEQKRNFVSKRYKLRLNNKQLKKPKRTQSSITAAVFISLLFLRSRSVSERDLNSNEYSYKTPTRLDRNVRQRSCTAGVYDNFVVLQELIRSL
jgi:hypothetical protein